MEIRNENNCELQSTSMELTKSPSWLARDTVKKRFSHLFKSLGRLSGDVPLDVDKSVQPTQTHVRRLPVAIKDKVAQELKQMCADGIIAAVAEPNPWISALLVFFEARTRRQK